MPLHTNENWMCTFKSQDHADFSDTPPHSDTAHCLLAYYHRGRGHIFRWLALNNSLQFLTSNQLCAPKYPSARIWFYIELYLLYPSVWRYKRYRFIIGTSILHRLIGRRAYSLLFVCPFRHITLFYQHYMPKWARKFKVSIRSLSYPIIRKGKCK